VTTGAATIGVAESYGLQRGYIAYVGTVKAGGNPNAAAVLGVTAYDRVEVFVNGASQGIAWRPNSPMQVLRRVEEG
jgi:hypothetical protein